MSFKKTLHNLEDITSGFDRLIGNLEILLKEIRPRTNVKNTRIGHIRRDLDKIFELDIPEMTKLFEIIIKLNQLNVVFDNKIEFNKEDAIRLVEGKYDLINDDKVQSHDFVFEFLMGARFALANGGSNKVSLSGQGDITVEGEIAVECKNIRSLNNLVKNVDKAKDQIEERATKGEVKFGIIALDISNVYPMEKAQEFIQRIFEGFYRNHAKVKEFQRFDQDIIDSVLEDRNLQNIIQSYIMHEAESALYSALPLRYNMGGG
ncbi:MULTISPECIES: hypothetical protein [unclassified Pseudomonas]|uniref:hypothetical protein n=1 Tax=unclassified Pseudomonas TaxID=196821 RepID=UPI000C2FA5D0|nr:MULTISPECIES: hypothetical protein [unclassified Pseudomonas]MCU1736895.1 hypothetical protein [Pseudomonas sp. 20S_6.2_Bac1]